MIVRLALPSSIDLDEAYDFRRFKVQLAEPVESYESVASAFAGLIAFESSETAWVPIKTLRRLPRVADDAEWRSGFDSMIEAARPFGWIDDKSQAIRAHIEWDPRDRRDPANDGARS